MRILVFGPTGGSGRQLVTQALAAGHAVTAIARRPEALDIVHERLTVHRGDVLVPDTFTAHVAGHDAVLSSLGIGYRRHATTVYSAGLGNVMEAMRGGGVKRLVCLSTSGLDLPANAPFIQRVVFGGILHRVLREPYADMRKMERLVTTSDLDWTVVRAARLTDGRSTGRNRMAVDEPLPRAWSISRADVARCMLTLLDEPTAARAVVEVAY